MKLPVYIYDITASDEASRIRGVGRYLQLLRDYLPEDVIFTDSIKKVPYDSLFIHPFYNFLQPPSTYTRIARKQLTVIHDLIPYKYPEEFPYGLKGLARIIINKFLLRHYDGIIVNSAHTAADVHTMLSYPQERITVVHHCVTKDYAKLLHRYKPSTPPFDMPYVIYVGDATWNKNLINLAQAIKIANIHAVFVGSNFIHSKMQHMLAHKPENPWLNELYGFYEEVQDDPRFHFSGFVSDEKLIDLYHHAVANVLVSRDEGFGFSYLEAGLCGCPSVLGDTAIAKEIAGDSALVAPTEDPLAIADTIKRFLDKKIRNEKKLLLKEQLKMFKPEKFATMMKTTIDTYRG